MVRKSVLLANQMRNLERKALYCIVKLLFRVFCLFWFGCLLSLPLWKSLNTIIVVKPTGNNSFLNFLSSYLPLKCAFLHLSLNLFMLSIPYIKFALFTPQPYLTPFCASRPDLEQLINTSCLMGRGCLLCSILCESCIVS